MFLITFTCLLIPSFKRKQVWNTGKIACGILNQLERHGLPYRNCFNIF